MIRDKMYMNAETGTVNGYEDWWYTDDDGNSLNAVLTGEVVEVVKNEKDEWTEA